jgi:hypothetical protein
MIIIITSALTVAFAAFAIYLSRQNSNLNETIFEKEGVIEALQNHSRKVENVLEGKSSFSWFGLGDIAARKLSKRNIALPLPSEERLKNFFEGSNTGKISYKGLEYVKGTLEALAKSQAFEASCVSANIRPSPDINLDLDSKIAACNDEPFLYRYT